MKVILIIGNSGACRREELTNISTEDIKYNDESIMVSITNTQNNLPREIMLTEGTWINFIKKYAGLRPKNRTHKRFFFQIWKWTLFPEVMCHPFGQRWWKLINLKTPWRLEVS
ncbi:hypothetical protein Zmor_026909 [Zophobas morio]|uniref:Uncharacterized protein n=1 Tax=Zophobas morio TaxID=2755281 RepID=A0AA38M5J5_9CUCU|nr:hypothetical protein Zmor_026909 [Zophobas morio]